MRHTFRDGDLLLIESSGHQTIYPGDVIAFRSQSTSRRIAHRAVKKIAKRAFVTCGDACQIPDCDLVEPEHILGKVVKVVRNDKTYPVFGGVVGLLWSFFLRFSNHWGDIFRHIYHGLRANSFLHLCNASFVSQVILTTPEGQCIKYLFLGRSVATWQPAQGRFTCRKPFDLFIKPPG